DISGGLLDPGILEVAAGAGAAIVLGHLRGAPATMMAEAAFDDVVGEVAVELRERIAAARAAGCREIWADPGIGFGKRLEHNLALLRALPALKAELGVPLMVGVSRKAFIGALTGKPPAERGFGTAAALTATVLGGVDAVRVHDVDAARDVVNVARALAGD
ncbi:MAG TPA: dihydropteroate synthase, partial [Polyangia bacterium]|nr:dihydropteroate synthase [Polyangia bacterium]